MLKIKDNVRLAVLVNDFGFKPKYDEDTGEIVALVIDVKSNIDEDLVITRKKSKVRLFRIYKQKLRRRNKPNNEIWIISKYHSYFSIDVLYDLIQAGLVEKV